MDPKQSADEYQTANEVEEIHHLKLDLHAASPSPSPSPEPLVASPVRLGVPRRLPQQSIDFGGPVYPMEGASALPYRALQKQVFGGPLPRPQAQRTQPPQPAPLARDDSWGWEGEKSVQDLTQALPPHASEIDVETEEEWGMTSTGPGTTVFPQQSVGHNNSPPVPIHPKTWFSASTPSGRRYGFWFTDDGQVGTDIVSERCQCVGLDDRTVMLICSSLPKALSTLFSLDIQDRPAVVLRVENGGGALWCEHVRFVFEQSHEPCAGYTYSFKSFRIRLEGDGGAVVEESDQSSRRLAHWTVHHDQFVTMQLTWPTKSDGDCVMTLRCFCERLDVVSCAGWMKNDGLGSEPLVLWRG